MTSGEESDGPPRDLRKEVEDYLTRTPDQSSDLLSKTPDEIIHELRVHQIELEIQKEELKKAHQDLKDSRDRYIDHYDFAPVGYFTLNKEALIAEVYHTGASMIGVVRRDLIHTRFRRFVTPPDHDQWDRFFLAILKDEKQHIVNNITFLILKTPMRPGPYRGFS
jgi:PAS domain-containing protein